MIETPPKVETQTPMAIFKAGKILPIYVNGAEVLRRQCEQVDPNDTTIPTLLADMFATMEGAEGIGLAAPQVGRPLRLFVIDMTEYEADKEMPNENEGLTKKVFINPTIVDSSETQNTYKEGCLSIPGINENVVRPTSITIEFLDENMKPQKETFSGIWARAIQHEYDHLNGKLFVDSVAQIRKQMLQSKLAAMAKGKYKARYKTK